MDEILILNDWLLLQNESGSNTTPALPEITATDTGKIVEILIATYNGSGTVRVPESISSNGQVGSLVAGSVDPVDKVALGVYQFLESQIGSISEQPISITGTNGSLKSVFYRILDNCKQVLPINVNAGHAYNVTQNLSLTRGNNSLTSLITMASSVQASVTTTNPARDYNIALTSTRNVGFANEFESANVSNAVISASLNVAAIIYNRLPLPAQIIVDVNDGVNSVHANSSGNTARTTGFTGTPTGTYGGYPITVTNFNSSSGIVTFTIPDYQESVVFPQPLLGHTLVLTNGSEVADFPDITFLLPVDKEYSVLETQTSGNRYLLSVDPGAAENDIVIFNEENGAFFIYPHGRIRSTNTGVKNIWRYDVSTNQMVLINLTVSEASVEFAINDGIIIADGTESTLTTTLVGAVTMLTVDGVVIDDLSGSAGSYTFTNPSLALGQTVPKFGQVVAVLTVDGVDYETIVNFNPDSTYAVTTLTGISVVEGSLCSAIACELGDQFILRTPQYLGVNINWVLPDSGILQTDNGSEQTIYRRSASTGVISWFTLRLPVLASFRTTADLTSWVKQNTSPFYDGLYPTVLRIE